MVLQPSRRWCCFFAPGSLHQIGKPLGSLVVTPLLTRLADRFLMNTHGREVNIVPRRTDYSHPPLIFSPSSLLYASCSFGSGHHPLPTHGLGVLSQVGVFLFSGHVFRCAGNWTRGKRLFFGQSGMEILRLNHFFFYQIGSLFLVSALPEAAGRRAFSFDVSYLFRLSQSGTGRACLYLFLGARRSARSRKTTA